MKLPKHLKHSLEKFQEFHDRPADTVYNIDIKKLPAELYRQGKALTTYYRSDKWGDGTHDYMHEHDTNVWVYTPEQDGAEVETPKFVQTCQVLVKLGKALGYDYIDPTGEERSVSLRKCDLFCTPNGKALVIIGDQKEVVAILWGGKLSVLPEGITG